MFEHSKCNFTCLFIGCGSYREAERDRRAEEDTEAIQGDITIISCFVVAKTNYSYSYLIYVLGDVYSITYIFIRRLSRPVSIVYSRSS